MSWGGGDYGNLNLSVTVHKKMKLKNQVRKKEKSLQSSKFKIQGVWNKAQSE